MMLLRKGTAIVAAAAAVMMGTVTAAEAAPRYDTKRLTITTQEQLDRILASKALDHRHLPTCDGTSARPTGAMSQLEYMAGHWEGLGWIMQKFGPMRFVQTEDVRFSSPTHLVVRGAAHNPLHLKGVMFRDRAVVSRRPDGTLQWLTTGWQGQVLDETLVPLTDGWRWDVVEDDPAFVERFEAHFSRHMRVWHETEQVSQDGGQTWNTVMEMTLVKTCDL